MPTFQLSVDPDILVLTLSHYFGTLTQGWVVSLPDIKLTPMPQLLSSSMAVLSEFDKEAGSLDPQLPNQCSTTLPISNRAILRDISKGTRYCRDRE